MPNTPTTSLNQINIPTEAPPIEYIIAAFSVDFDGSILNSEYHEQKRINPRKRKRIEEFNQPFLEFVEEEITQKKIAVAIFELGTTRNSIELDYLNTNKWGSCSCFYGLLRITKTVKKRLQAIGNKAVIGYETYTRADEHGNQKHGSNFNIALKYFLNKDGDYKISDRFISRYGAATCILEESKLPILYAQMHKLASETQKHIAKSNLRLDPSQVKYQFNFTDDSEVILSQLKIFYAGDDSHLANTDLIPKNMVVRLYKYNGEKKPELYIEIIGTGEIDRNYDATIKKMFELSEPSHNTPNGEPVFNLAQYFSNTANANKLAQVKAKRNISLNKKNPQATLSLKYLNSIAKNELKYVAKAKQEMLIVIESIFDELKILTKADLNHTITSSKEQFLEEFVQLELSSEVLSLYKNSLLEKLNLKQNTENNKLDRVKYCIEKLNRIEKRYLRDRNFIYKKSHLIKAAKWGHKKTIKKMIKHGVKPINLSEAEITYATDNLDQYENHFALIIAAKNGHSQAVEILFSETEKQLTITGHADKFINVYEQALVQAALNHKKDVVQFIIEKISEKSIANTNCKIEYLLEVLDVALATASTSKCITFLTDSIIDTYEKAYTKSESSQDLATWINSKLQNHTVSFNLFNYIKNTFCKIMLIKIDNAKTWIELANLYKKCINSGLLSPDYPNKLVTWKLTESTDDITPILVAKLQAQIAKLAEEQSIAADPALIETFICPKQNIETFRCLEQNQTAAEEKRLINTLLRHQLSLFGNISPWTRRLKNKVAQEILTQAAQITTLQNLATLYTRCQNNGLITELKKYSGFWESKYIDIIAGQLIDKLQKQAANLLNAEPENSENKAIIEKITDSEAKVVLKEPWQNSIVALMRTSSHPNKVSPWINQLAQASAIKIAACAA